MTAPTIEELPVRVPGRTLPPPLVHSGCRVCTGTKRTFCGQKCTDPMPAATASKASTTCAVCVELENAHDWAAHFWGQS